MAQTSAHPSNRKDQLGKLETQESGQCNIYNLSPLDWFNWKDTNQLNWCTVSLSPSPTRGTNEVLAYSRTKILYARIFKDWYSVTQVRAAVKLERIPDFMYSHLSPRFLIGLMLELHTQRPNNALKNANSSLSQLVLRPPTPEDHDG